MFVWILYVKILSNSILVENSSLRDNSEDFLSIFDDLTPKDLIVLKNMYEQQKDMKHIISLKIMNLMS
jgi:hypothetical protein